MLSTVTRFFLHGLQQGGLGLGVRAVDFVGERDLRKNRALVEGELLLALLKTETPRECPRAACPV